jgi:hypothetical protein
MLPELGAQRMDVGFCCTLETCMKPVGLKSVASDARRLWERRRRPYKETLNAYIPVIRDP